MSVVAYYDTNYKGNCFLFALHWGFVEKKEAQGVVVAPNPILG